MREDIGDLLRPAIRPARAVGAWLRDFMGAIASLLAGETMDLHCPACAQMRPMRSIRRTRHSQLAALATGFFSFVFFVLGFFPIFWVWGWLVSIAFFMLFLYWGLGTDKFWKCTVCGSLLPRA